MSQENNAFETALAFAKQYYDTHLFVKRISDGQKNRRRELTEEMRLGGCRKIVEAMEGMKNDHMALRQAAEGVIASWEKDDLAAAVRTLDETIKKSKGE